MFKLLISISELAAEMEEKQEYFNSLTRELLTFEKPFQDSWTVINSVLGMKKNRPSISGGKLIKSFPLDFIDRYQNIHSVRFKNNLLTYMVVLFYIGVLLF